MSIRKEDKLTTITSRDLARMISMREQIPIADVQSVLNCFCEVIEMAIPKGYKINLPSSLGVIYHKTRQGAKKGNIMKVPSFMYDKIKDGNPDLRYYQDSDGTYYTERLKDAPNYLFPIVRFNKAFRRRVKEESINNGIVETQSSDSSDSE